VARPYQQEHLHRNICRRRTLVAIGTHDLDTLQVHFCRDHHTTDIIIIITEES
jgi:phenylalanyl-tRNA synthetase beta subunit